MGVPPKKWRSEPQLRGVQSQVQRGINSCEDGATVEIDVATAHAVIEIIEQARHTENGHAQNEREMA